MSGHTIVFLCMYPASFNMLRRFNTKFVFRNSGLPWQAELKVPSLLGKSEPQLIVVCD